MFSTLFSSISFSSSSVSARSLLSVLLSKITPFVSSNVWYFFTSVSPSAFCFSSSSVRFGKYLGAIFKGEEPGVESV